MTHGLPRSLLLGLAVLAACHTEPPPEAAPPPLPGASIAPTLAPPAREAPTPTLGGRSTPALPAPITLQRPELPGPRLRAVHVAEVGGSARAIVEVMDTRTGQPCRIGPGTEGATVSCVPVAGASIVYLDERCETEALLETDEGPGRWVTAFDATHGQRALRVGDHVSYGVDLRYTRDAAGGCGVHPAPRGPALHRLGEELDELVRGPIERVLLDDRLAASTFFGDDGSEFQLELVDVLGRAPCEPVDTEAGARCRPAFTPTADEGTFDERCERRAIVAYGLDPVVQLHETSGADLGVFRFEGGGRGEDNAVTIGRRAEDGSCQTERVELGRRTYYVGTPYPAADWPAVALDVAGDGRLTPNAAFASSGATLATVSAWPDRAFDDAGTPCGPMWVDGTLRCVPPLPEGTMPSPTSFADPACTIPAVLFQYSPEIGELTMFTVHDGGERGGLPVGRVLEVSHSVCSPHYRREGSACRSTNQRSTHLVLGAEVPAERFAELRQLIARP